VQCHVTGRRGSRWRERAAGRRPGRRPSERARAPRHHRPRACMHPGMLQATGALDTTSVPRTSIHFGPHGRYGPAGGHRKESRQGESARAESGSPRGADSTGSSFSSPESPPTTAVASRSCAPVDVLFNQRAPAKAEVVSRRDHLLDLATSVYVRSCVCVRPLSLSTRMCACACTCACVRVCLCVSDGADED
jgi:hypothetical protein